MAHDPTRQHAHELIDRMAPGQVSAVVGLLEIMLDPLGRTLANVPFEDEPETEDERKAIDISQAWVKEHRGEGIAHEDVLAEFGLSPKDFERLGSTPLPPEPPVRVDNDA
jgi:hypothetical protein